MIEINFILSLLTAGNNIREGIETISEIISGRVRFSFFTFAENRFYFGTQILKSV